MWNELQIKLKNISEAQAALENVSRTVATAGKAGNAAIIAIAAFATEPARKKEDQGSVTGVSYTLFH